MAIPVRLRPIRLWAPRWGEEQLRAKCAEDEAAYNRGFRLQAFSDEDATFKAWHKCKTHGVAIGEIQRNDWPKFTGVDLSGKKRPGNAIVTVALDPKSRRRFPCDVRMGKWSSDETAAQIQDVNELLNPTVIMVENNGYQDALIDWARSKKDRYGYWMKLEPTTTGSNKMDPALGLPGLQVEFNNQAWVIPADEFEGHSVDCPCNWCRFDKEFRFHPLYSSSDLVMATWFARQGIELYGSASQSLTLGDVSAR